MTAPRTFLVAGMAAILALGACGGSSPPPNAGDTANAVPSYGRVRLAPATGPAVLTVTGAAGGSPVVVDFPGLDAVATRRYDIYEPFEKRNVAFKGVELAAVLDAAGVPASATRVRMTALDDYLVDLDMADVRKGGVILATRADGAAITVKEGGPIRIVFRDGSEVGKNTDRWIWSLNRLEVS